MRRRFGFTLVELLVVIAIIGILIALLLPAVQAAREAARRTQCINHLKQMGLAVHNHVGVHKHFPTGGSDAQSAGDPNVGPGPAQPGSWVYNILPFVEEESLHELGKGLTGIAKAAATKQRLQTPVSWMLCPSRRAATTYPNALNRTYSGAAPSTLAKGDYAACSGAGQAIQALAFAPGVPRVWSGVCYWKSAVRTADVTDGMSSTYFAGEKFLSPDYYLNGLSNGDDDNQYTGDNIDVLRSTYYDPNVPGSLVYSLRQDTPGLDYAGAFGSTHASTCNMLFCDGSVHGISYSIDPEIHRRLGNRKDDLPIDGNQF